MKCIFPCLQLIYFYIGVEYIVLCYFFFPLLWGVEIGEISVALRMPCWDGPRKREHRQRQKDLIFNRRRLTFSKKVITLFKNYFKCYFIFTNTFFLFMYHASSTQGRSHWTAVTGQKREYHFQTLFVCDECPGISIIMSTQINKKKNWVFLWKCVWVLHSEQSLAHHGVQNTKVSLEI